MERAICTDNRDPDNLGRIKVMIPRRTGASTTDWIWPVVTTGFFVLPDPGDQVWVDYEDGDLSFPVWLGRAQVREQVWVDYENEA